MTVHWISVPLAINLVNLAVMAAVGPSLLVRGGGPGIAWMLAAIQGFNLVVMGAYLAWLLGRMGPGRPGSGTAVPRVTGTSR